MTAVSSVWLNLVHGTPSGSSQHDGVSYDWLLIIASIFVKFFVIG